MCGIVGIFNRDEKPVSMDLIVRMARTLVHRGPDEEGYFVNTSRAVSIADPQAPLRKFSKDTYLETGLSKGNVGLGHRRLSIIDLASGQQPLSNENSTIWITFNGEIYNFQELKKELEGKGHVFRTNSDTETIIHGYEEWGENSLERLRGMFAFALWDENHQRMLLARDRVGKKPLYYLQDKNRFIFGSEIKAILETPGVSRDIDLTSLSDYLSLLYVPSPKTIFQSIQKIPPAHYAIVKKDSFEVRPYWNISFFPDYDLTENRMIDDLLEILDEATRIRMISEVPLGAFLSGGVDSSGIVALMSGASPNPVITNSVSFSEASYDESQHARRVAELFSTDHHEFHVTPEAIPIIEKLSWHYDEPFADSSAVPTYYVSKAARESVTVSLSGDGGDENFAGYRRYYMDRRENFIRNLVPASIRRSFFKSLGKLYPKADYLPQIFRGKAFLSNVSRDPIDAYFFSVTVLYDEEKSYLLNHDIIKELGNYKTFDFFKEIYGRAPANDHLSKIQYLDIKTYLCEDILTKVDRASMASSLEVRCPVLDHVFMEYAARIPSEKKLIGTNGKYIFKKALKKFLPDDILYRKKMGFGVPILEWLKKDIRDYAENLVIDGNATKTYFSRKHINKIWKEHQLGIRNHSSLLWIIMMLNLWYDKFIET